MEPKPINAKKHMYIFFQKFVLYHDKILKTNGIVVHSGSFLESFCIWIKHPSAWSSN